MSWLYIPINTAQRQTMESKMTTSSLQDMATRYGSNVTQAVNAIIAASGVSEADANSVLAEYRRRKLVKIGHGAQECEFKFAELLEAKTIAGCLKALNSKGVA